MIGRLTGRLEECSPNSILLDVGGVGYELQIPLSTFYVLSGRGNGQATLHVYTHLREDALQLFGFATAEERSAFQHCLAVSGVGPKMALAILSGIDAQELRRAVREEDRARLQRIPGVGRKTAERLLIELRDRLDPGGGGSRGHLADDARRPGAGSPSSALRDDAVSALVNLGYAVRAAGRAVDAALARLGEAATLQQTLKESLSSLV